MTRSSARLVALAGLTLLLVPLYLLPASQLGLWEPWETDIASLAWHVATEPGQSVFAPLRDGEFVARPWLQTALAVLGYRLGDGSELGFRLPFALLHLGALGFAFLSLERFFGVWRAALGTLLTGLAPALLLGSFSLAGQASAFAPIALFLLAAIVAVHAAAPLRASLIVFAGVCLGFTVWGMGVAGYAIATGTIALTAIGSRRGERLHLPTFATGTIFALLSVCWPLVNLGIDGLVIVSESGTNDTGIAAIARAGWGDWKELLAAWIGFGVPTGLLLAAVPSSPLRTLWHPVATPIAALAAALLIFLPLGAIESALAAQGVDPAWATPYLVHQSILSERVLDAHVTFDILIRIAAFGVYPTVLFAPWALGYLTRTSDSACTETDDATDAARSVKRMLLLWTGLAFAIGGFAASLSRQIAFPIALPIAFATALSLTDRSFFRSLAQRPAVLRAAGLGAIFLLLVLSKDIRGTFNEELGRPGPHVLFEALLIDGKVQFPDTYAFRRTSLFVGLWALLIGILYFQPLEYLRATLRELCGTADSAPTRWWHRATRPLARAGRRIEALVGRLQDLIERFLRGVPPTHALAAAFAGVTLLWTAQLAWHDVGRVSHHFSQKGLIETWERFGGDEEALYTVGIDAGNASYYLRDDVARRVERIGDIVPLFCDAQAEQRRVFAVLRAEALPEVYQLLRENRIEACEFQDIPVLDGRSSRYLLLSNELHPDRGEEQQSVIAANVFTDDTLPADIDRPAVRTVVDEKLELVGSTLRTVDGGRYLEVSTWWRVLERPRSSYRSFIHVDFSGNRLNGDHDLVDGQFPMNRWVVGDIVRDVYRIRVSRADRAGTYTAYYGFFRGDDRLRVTEPTVRDNRIDLGQVELGR